MLEFHFIVAEDHRDQNKEHSVKELEVFLAHRTISTYDVNTVERLNSEEGHLLGRWLKVHIPREALDELLEGLS